MSRTERSIRVNWRSAIVAPYPKGNVFVTATGNVGVITIHHTRHL